MFATKLNLFQSIVWWEQHLEELSGVVQVVVSVAGLFRGLKLRYKLNQSGAWTVDEQPSWQTHAQILLPHLDTASSEIFPISNIKKKSLLDYSSSQENSWD